MCSSNIIKETVDVARTSVGITTLGQSELALRAFEGKSAIGKDITEFGKIPDAPVIPEPPDETAKEERARRRALRRRVAGRAGPGRRPTLKPQGTGTGPTGLKQKTGQ